MDAPHDPGNPTRTTSGKTLAIWLVSLVGIAVLAAVVITIFVARPDKADAPNSGAGDSTTGETVNGNEPDNSGENPETAVPIGQVVEEFDWSAVVNSVVAVDSDESGRTADAGNVLVKVNLTATYTGTATDGDFLAVTLRYLDPDGNPVELGDFPFTAENQFGAEGNLKSGESVTGDMILEVPAAKWRNGVLGLTPSLAADETFIALK